MKNVDEMLGIKIEGHILIRDADTKKELVNKRNAINYENFSVALAKSISNKSDGTIYEMVFGNGGSTIDGLGVITYLPPNTQGENATIYNETYSKVVDDNSPLNTSPSTNFITVSHSSNTYYSDITITCTLDYGEPSGQEAFDDGTDLSSDYVFDELGIRSVEGKMLTHVIFHPVQKALNRSIEVIYTIRISVA